MTEARETGMALVSDTSRRIGTLKGIVSVLLLPGQAATTRRQAASIGLALPRVADTIADIGVDATLTKYLMGWGDIDIEDAFDELEKHRATVAERILGSINIM